MSLRDTVDIFTAFAAKLILRRCLPLVLDGLRRARCTLC